MSPLRWRMLFVVLITAFAVWNVAPTGIYFSQPKELRSQKEKLAEVIPDWLPEKHINLGLDLQGGVQLVLGVDADSAIDNKLARMATELTRWATDNNKPLEKAYTLKGKGILRAELSSDADIDKFKEEFKEEFPGLVLSSRDGTQIDYEYSETQSQSIKDSAMKQAERVIRTRVDKWGVSEPRISRRADGSVLVQLPGFSDTEKAKGLLGKTAQLMFKIVDDEFKGFDNLSDLPDGMTLTNNGGQTAVEGEDRAAIAGFLKPFVPEGKELYFQRTAISGGKKYKYISYVVNASTELGGDDVLDAQVVTDTESLENRPAISVRFTGPGGKRFEETTGRNVKKRMAMILEDIVEMAPVINGRIPGGQARINLGGGRPVNEVYEEAREMSLVLKSGALPADIQVEEERQVGASLGPELANQGIRATLLGLALVFFFMMVWYRRPGMIACIALLLNGVFLLALMGFFGFSLTLPGIAGFILTLGMAVDANVLINERIRQEFKEGKTSQKAVAGGFEKVKWTIIDANVTTLIAALVLLETNSSGPIRGFATTLMIGLIVSMFTSLYCTRIFFDVVLSRSVSEKGLKRWLGADAAEKAKPFNFDFLKNSKFFTAVTMAVIIGIVGFTTVKGMNWSVDFAGGTEIEVHFDKDVPASEIRTVGKEAKISNFALQALDGGQKKYIIRFDSQKGLKEGADKSERQKASEQSSFKVREILNQKFAQANPSVQRVDFVGPQIGKELRTQGVVSVFYALLGVLAYIAYRFDMRFAPGAIVKMSIDVLLILGVYSIFGISFDLTSVAALLTVVGYSVNDTIVIYDRIRENIMNGARRGLYENINLSLNETLPRTINTSITTIIALSGILIFGTSQIWNFALAMTVGVLVATMTSIFVASFLVLYFEEFKKKRKQRA